jgi:hypothetical protein
VLLTGDVVDVRPTNIHAEPISRMSPSRQLDAISVKSCLGSLWEAWGQTWFFGFGSLGSNLVFGKSGVKLGFLVFSDGKGLVGPTFTHPPST